MKNISLTVLAISVAVGSLGISTAASAKPQRQKMPSFEQLDANGDGVITKADLEAARAARFVETDTNGDGFIDVDEVLAKMEARGDQRKGGKRDHNCDKDAKGEPKNEELIQAQKSERQALAAKHMIERADTNGDGKLSMDETRQPNMEKMFEHMDADGNGEISSDEWNEAMHKREHRRDRDHKGGRRGN